MFSERQECQILEDQVKEFAGRILDFIQKECEVHGHSAGVCYVAMRLFLENWGAVMGPERVKQIEKSFQIISNAPISNC